MSRRANRAQPTVALFPFLAVLLCTMGSLILLLLLIARQARSQAEAEQAAATVKGDAAAVEEQREVLQWRVDQLSASRDKTAGDLAEARALLSHLEDHIIRMRQQIVDAETALRLLDSQKSLDEGARVRLKTDLADLRRRVAEAEAKLKEAEKAGKRPQAFAIVPFDGEGGTRRRPIYIECRADTIIVQPEGIVLKEEDFGGALLPANPLASAVRAASEYIARTSKLQTGEEPYPLLLVRPSGIPAYYAARAAMSSWDSDFGYELIEEDWPLEFPPADPQMAQMMADAVQEARLRQVMVARAAPSIRPEPTAVYGVSRSGHGVERIGGGQAWEDGGGKRSGGNRTGRPSSPRTGGYAGGNGLGTENGSSSGGGWGMPGSPTGGVAGGGTNGNGSGGATSRDGSVFGGGAAPGQAAGSLAGDTGGLGNGPQLGNAQGGGNTPGVNGTPGGSGPGETGNGSGSYASRNGGSNGTSAGGTQPGAARGSDADRYADSNGGGSGASNSPGGTSKTAGGSGGGSAFGSMGGAGGSSSHDPTADMSQQPSMSMMNSPNSSQVESMARKRGADWGLPNKGANATGLTRPIQIYCASDRITILAGAGGDKQIMFEGSTESAVDSLVSSIWDQVNTWGLAGRGMYWKPILSMHVAPDGVYRYTELRTLLEGSGLEVTGKPISMAAPAAPGLQR